MGDRKNKKKSNICSFIFDTNVTQITVRVTGVERTWNFLKVEFDRHSDGLPSPTARYYQTLYGGPRLFGADNNDVIYYHDKEKWTPYETARNITYSYDSDYVEGENECDDVCLLPIACDVEEMIHRRQISQNVALWYVKSKETIGPPDSDEKDYWLSYSELENEIIEETFQQKSDTLSFIELDDYLIDFNRLLQVNKLNNNQQQMIKRVVHSKSEQKHLRQERFSEPLSLVASTTHTYGKDNEWCPFLVQWMQSPHGKHCLFNAKKCLKKAIEGILTEGRLIGKGIEAKYLVRELEMCQGLTMKDTSKYCVHLFTRDSFLYRVVNTALRENDLSKVDTLGPYCYLLRAYIRTKGTEYSGSVYRGCYLSEEQINQYRQAISSMEWKTWPSFTSTSKRRQAAEMFNVNTLFIIDIRKVGTCSIRAFNIEYISQFPTEEEVLLPAGVLFQVLYVKEDEKTKKWTIHVQL